MDKYLLAAKDPSGIVPGTGDMNVVKMNATRGSGGELVTFFTLRMTRSQQQLDSQTPIL